MLSTRAILGKTVQRHGASLALEAPRSRIFLAATIDVAVAALDLTRVPLRVNERLAALLPFIPPSRLFPILLRLFPRRLLAS